VGDAAVASAARCAWRLTAKAPRPVTSSAHNGIVGREGDVGGVRRFPETPGTHVHGKIAAVEDGELFIRPPPAG
jgi:hypothetical protein